MAVDSNNLAPNDANSAESAAIGYRTAVIPFLVYIGTAIKNPKTILTDIAPWAYLGFAVILLVVIQTVQRRQGRAWSWSVSLAAGFCIAAFALLGSMAAATIFAPAELAPK